MAEAADEVVSPGLPGLKKPEEWVRSQSRKLILVGVLTLLLGVLSMAAPLAMGAVTVILVGAFLLVTGVARVVIGFQSKAWGQVLIGALLAITGVLLLFRPLEGLVSITVVVSVFFFAHGVIEAIYAFQLRPVRGWWWALVSGLVAIVLGVMIWKNLPSSAAWAVGVLVGVNFLFSGITLLWLGICGKSLAKDIEAAGSGE